MTFWIDDIPQEHRRFVLRDLKWLNEHKDSLWAKEWFLRLKHLVWDWNHPKPPRKWTKEDWDKLDYYETIGYDF